MKCLAIFLTILCFCSCGEDVTTTIIAPGATVGNIRGRVRLYDSVNAYQPLSDASGVRIELEGSAYSTTTNAAGEWTLANIPGAIYKSIKISKEGFSFDKQLEYEFIGNGTLSYGVSDLYRRSLVSVKLTLGAFEEYKQITARDTIIYNSNGPFHAYLYDTIIHPQGKTTFSAQILNDRSNSSYNYYSVFHISKTPEIDPYDASTFQWSTNVLQHDLATGERPCTVTVPELLRSGFQHGQIAYCVVYSALPTGLNTLFVDTYYERQIYTGFSPNHSEVKSFVVP